MDPVLGEHVIHLRERFEQVFESLHKGGKGYLDSAELHYAMTRVEKLRDSIASLAAELEDLVIEEGEEDAETGTASLWRPARIAP